LWGNQSFLLLWSAWTKDNLMLANKQIKKEMFFI
jgi:hypothetical protein